MIRRSTVLAGLGESQPSDEMNVMYITRAKSKPIMKHMYLPSSACSRVPCLCTNFLPEIFQISGMTPKSPLSVQFILFPPLQHTSTKSTHALSTSHPVSYPKIASMSSDTQRDKGGSSTAVNTEREPYRGVPSLITIENAMQASALSADVETAPEAESITTSKSDTKPKPKLKLDTKGKGKMRDTGEMVVDNAPKKNKTTKTVHWDER